MKRSTMKRSITAAVIIIAAVNGVAVEEVDDVSSLWRDARIFII